MVVRKLKSGKNNLDVCETEILENLFLLSVVPQPVYMNMGELAALATQKASAAALQNNDYSPLADDSPDLKTPTAEDIMTVPEQKV